ncbi:MAG: DNA alkylation repair protein [Chloroflexi bacterium]|nr:DNA alkylation repair protein [Chloroflexota bacterium]
MTLVPAIRSALAQRADPSRAAGMQRYMRSSMPYRGVTTPVVRAACRAVFAQFPMESFASWASTVRALWDEAQFREERYAALELVAYRRYANFRTLDALPLYTYLITTGAWWDLVDGLATHEVGHLLREYPPEMNSLVREWSRGSDLWLRRTSIICQIGYKQSTDQALLYACIEPSLSERDFFLRKAIGWALREYAKAEPEAVRRYVAENADRLSGLSRREALKHLGTRPKTRLNGS